MAKKSPPQQIRSSAQSALAAMGSTVWHIHPSAFDSLQGALQTMAETGRTFESVLQVAPESFALLPSAEYSRKVQRTGSLAVISIAGIIEPDHGVYSEWLGGTSCSAIRSDLRTAASDPGVTEIALVINSPGGIAFGLQETATLIAEVNKSKPVTAYCRHMTASAAYFLACSAGRIVATPSTSVGSIGTIVGHMNYSGMLAEMGLTYTQITHGENKGEGSPYLPLDDKSKAGIQEFVNAYGEQFVAHVAQQRGVTKAEVMERFGQGRVYIASEAADRGMIDGIGMFEDRASQQSGGRSITSNGTATAPSTTTATEPPKVKKLIALMYSLEILQSMEASAEVVEAAVCAFCVARGVDVPRADDGKSVDEARCIKLITDSRQSGSPTQKPDLAKPEMTATQYKERRDEIASSAKQMNAGRTAVVITAEHVATALDSQMSLEEIREHFCGILEKSQDGQPLNVTTGTIASGTAGEDRFIASAVDSLAARMGHKVEGTIPSDVRNMSLMEMGLTCARFSGMRLSGNSEDMALKLLQMSPELAPLNSTSYNRPGDFPNLLSNLANKILDAAQMVSGAQFSLWTNKMMDLPNFQPRTVLGTGVFDTLDKIEDDDEAKQLSMAEELKGWLQSDRFGNKVALTPRMIANDDLDAFNQQLMSLAKAHDLTLNELCLQLLAGNVTLADGTALFDAGHTNLVSGGGAPDATQANKNFLLHGAMKAFGSNTSMGSLPNVALVPLAHATAAKQTYYDISRLNEVKVAQTDATINVHRGTLDRVVIEPKLDAYSAAKWYTFDTNVRTIVHAFQVGYGPSGRRTSWFEQSRGSRYIQLEGSFGAAAVGFRGAVQNPGS